MTKIERSPLAVLRRQVVAELRHDIMSVRSALAPWVESRTGYDEATRRFDRVRPVAELPENRIDAWSKLATRCFTIAERFEALGRTALSNAAALERKQKAELRAEIERETG